MELKINISEDTYEEIKKDDKILLSKVHELFDAVRNGTPTDEVGNHKVDEKIHTFILNKKEADIFNSLSNEQKEVVCKLLDNAVEKAQKEKDKADELTMPTKKEIDDHVEICRLMTVYLGRKFTPHEGHFMALYKTIEQNKDMFAGLKCEDKILVKLLIRSLVP
jgi:phosphopantetheine adenylyltransferase